MARKIGYSLVNLGSGEEMAWNPTLPWQLTYTLNDVGQPTGTVNIDKLGLELPRSDNPQYKVVERWVTDNPPVGSIETGYSNPVYDGTQVNVNGVYTPIDPAVKAEQDRKDSIKNDPTTQDLVNKVKTMTGAQIDNYIQTNVTDLASAKQVLARIIKVLAGLV